MSPTRGARLLAPFLLLLWMPFALNGERHSAERREREPLPEGVSVERDISYGSHPRQRFDVYHPLAGTGSAPVILMVHGGAWRTGDKELPQVVDNKVARWVPRGVIFVSTNYRLLPDADALSQAEDVARALARAQREIVRFGGDPSRFVLMGHSAGAHLVALLAADPSRAIRHGASAWLGTVVLDSAALDVVRVMERRHLRFYDRAFGSDPERWRDASPFQQLGAAGGAILAVCSQRRPAPCDDARRFVRRTSELGRPARTLERDLSHRAINERLGLESSYTSEVEAFLGGLDAGLRRAFAQKPGRGLLASQPRTRRPGEVTNRARWFGKAVNPES